MPIDADGLINLETEKRLVDFAAMRAARQDYFSCEENGLSGVKRCGHGLAFRWSRVTLQKTLAILPF